MTANDQHHEQAYALYIASGEQRTYRVVASKLGVSERTVRHWAKQGQWKQRLQEDVLKTARHLADQAAEVRASQQGRFRKISELALARLAKDIADGNIRYTLTDLERLIRLQAEFDRPYIPGLESDDPKKIVASFFYWWGNQSSELRQWVIKEMRSRRAPQPPGPRLP